MSLFTCARCGRTYSNPLGHTCVSRTDFARRKAEAAKTARKTRPPHYYQACDDPECGRLPCRAWKEGRAEGRKEGRQEGYAEGRAAGQAQAAAGGKP